jgi:hypothetical protein
MTLHLQDGHPLEDFPVFLAEHQVVMYDIQPSLLEPLAADRALVTA